MLNNHDAAKIILFIKFRHNIFLSDRTNKPDTIKQITIFIVNEGIPTKLLGLTTEGGSTEFMAAARKKKH